MAVSDVTRSSFNTGIYEIVNTVNGKRYIGSAVNIRTRWAEHRRQLRDSTHHSVALQRAWARYGADAFDFRRLEECDRAQLIVTEQRHLDEVKPEYNICKKAASTLGIKQSADVRAAISKRLLGNTYTLGFKHSPEVCARMGAGKIGLKYAPRSAEHRAKISAGKMGKSVPRTWTTSDATRAKLSAAFKGRKMPLAQRMKSCRIDVSQVREIRRLRSSRNTYAQIVLLTGVSLSSVTRICKGVRYEWVDPDRSPDNFKPGLYTLSDAERLRRSEARKGAKASPETRAKISAANLGRKHPPEFGAAISARNKGVPRPKSPEHRAKISATLMGHHYNAGIPKSEAHRRHLSEAKLGVPNPKLVGNKHRAGKKRSPEEIAKSSASLKATWARRKAEGLVEAVIAKQVATRLANLAKRKASA